MTARPSIYDIAPTVLTLLGLPVPADSDGRVLVEILEPGFLAEHPVTTLPSYDPYFTREGAVAEVDEEEILEQLRSLGYIE